MASGDGATSVRILNENVDKLTKLPDMVKAFEELTSEEVIVAATMACYFVVEFLCSLCANTGGVPTLRTQDTSDPRHFGPRTLRTQDTSALVYKTNLKFEN